MIEIRTVLCPVDLTPLSERALELAISVCQKVGARLVLEHNLDSRPPGYLGVSWMWSEEHEKDERKKAGKADEAVRHMLGTVPAALHPEAKVTRGPVDGTLLHLARELPAELLVMGTHGPSSSEHKSLTERIIIQAPCPVLTLSEGYEPQSVMAALEGTRPEKLEVVVPVDFTPRARAALDFGIALAERMPHRMVLVHAVKPGEAAAAEVAASRDRLAEMTPEGLADRVTIEVEVGEPAAVILEATRRHDAIFVLMAAHGKSAFRRYLFGTTTLGILRGCECPVLFIPPRAKAAA